ncbi:MAG: diguanylate cyclase/phosphodiesterase (GGDEF & EAL domains) with PAS/PAC sensor(s) [Candidatus Rifleibacterium amylolyticum]|nr:MAG: diguanylate cyclase/phosphodiesterase (GGDEF & EAL domains) with PAS/PAC sensor(s) [Candidatus Rifleibacterium amylolyticum]
MRINHDNIARLSSLMAILFALFGLLSYLPGFKILGSLSEDYIPMAPSTSVCFLILGLTLLCLGKNYSSRLFKWSVIAGTAFVFIFGLLCLLGAWLNMDLNFENRLVPSAGRFNDVPVARMAPVTGFVFSLIAASIFIQVLKHFAGLKSKFALNLKGFLGLSSFFAGSVFVLAYLYGRPLLYQQKTIPMALTTALAFVFLSLSALLKEKDDLPLSLLTGTSTRSYLLRFLFPFAVLSIVLSDLITLYFARITQINPALVSGILACVSVAISLFVATLIAQHVGGEIDQSRSEIKRSNELLKVSEEKLLTTLNSIGDAVIATDTEQKVVLMNPIAEKLTGWALAEALGRNISEIFVIVNAKTRKPAQIPIEKVLAVGAIVGLANHTVLVSRDGKEYQIADSAAPIKDPNGGITGVVMVFHDVTAQYLMQEEFHKVERLKSIGILAGGIAHDFNNILTGIYGNIALAREAICADHPAIKALAESELSLERAVSLTRQLLTFSTGGSPVKEHVSLGSLIKEVASFDLAGSNVKLVLDCPPDLQMADVDRGQIQQVFSNLTVNAKEAMPSGGHLYIGLEPIEVAADEESRLSQGKYIKIIVRDEGCGIPPELHQRIFDPYFSTKKTGNGLGLATVFSIIKRHGGDIKLESLVGSGTTFTLYLPATEVAEDSVVKASQPAGFDEDFKPRILVMDDEEAIRKLVIRALGRLGCEVTAVADGKAAVETYQREFANGQPFDAIILDLTVPGGLGGAAAIGEILSIDPDAVAIVSSGYAEDPIMADYEKHGFKGIVCKPYSLNTLHTVLHSVIRRR